MRKKRKREEQDSFHTKSNKRQSPVQEIEFAQPHTKRMKYMRVQKIQEKKRKREEQDSFHMRETALKRHCLNTERKHSYLSSSSGMVYFTPEYIKHIKES